MVDAKWSGFRRAFKNFDPVAVASFTEAEIDRLAADASILRSRNKIKGTIKNAQTILELDQQFGGFQNYLRSKSSYEELSNDMQKRFKYLGRLSIYYLLFRVKENVPPFDQWIQTIEGHHPRMKEMVEFNTRLNKI